jgi:hypothetical protein
VLAARVNTGNGKLGISISLPTHTHTHTYITLSSVGVAKPITHPRSARKNWAAFPLSH